MTTSPELTRLDAALAVNCYLHSSRGASPGSTAAHVRCEFRDPSPKSAFGAPMRGSLDFGAKSAGTLAMKSSANLG